jgi:hypothetical protein
LPQHGITPYEEGGPRQFCAAYIYFPSGLRATQLADGAFASTVYGDPPGACFAHTLAKGSGTIIGIDTKQWTIHKNPSYSFACLDNSNIIL